jgi:hypothetical protein
MESNFASAAALKFQHAGAGLPRGPSDPPDRNDLRNRIAAHRIAAQAADLANGYRARKRSDFVMMPCLSAREICDTSRSVATNGLWPGYGTGAGGFR